MAFELFLECFLASQQPGTARAVVLCLVPWPSGGIGGPNTGVFAMWLTAKVGTGSGL